MGKKTVEDSRRFEKDRRDKLNAAFEVLSKLLPDHDPLVTLSKIEILRRAAQYIKQLQDQNDEIMKLGSDSALRTESEKLRKRVTHLLIKTKELVDALKSAGVPIPTNKKKKKRKVAQNNSSNQNVKASVKQPDIHTLKEDGQALQRVRCSCMKTSPERKPLKESNPVAVSQSPISSASTTASTVLNNNTVLAVMPPLISAPIMATRIQPAPEKQPDGTAVKEDGPTQRRVKCGCKKTSPERKLLQKLYPVVSTESPSMRNTTSVSRVNTARSSTVLNNNTVIAVTPPLLSAPIMATRVQGIPIAPNSVSSSSTNENPTIIPRHIAPSLSTAVVEGSEVLGNRNVFTSQPKLSTPVTIASNFVKEVILPNANKKAVNVVTTTSSSILTTQSIVNSTQLISLPQNNMINNSIVAPRIQNVPLLEKNILSNLGPGTLILADGRIMNVPPIVPQIVVKQQPAVILMPTAKTKEKLIIPKKREVTKTTFSNKAPIPAIPSFRLESCPRVRPKKKPKPPKKVENMKNGGFKRSELNKKRKLEVPQNGSSGKINVSEEVLSKDLTSTMLPNEQSKESVGENTSGITIVTSVESNLVMSSNSSISHNEGSTTSQADNSNSSTPKTVSTCLNEISTSTSVQSTVISPCSLSLAENTPSNKSPLAVDTIDQSAPGVTEQIATSDPGSCFPENTPLLQETGTAVPSPSLSTFPVDPHKNLNEGMVSGNIDTMSVVVLPETLPVYNSLETDTISTVIGCNNSNNNQESDLPSNGGKTTKSATSCNDILTNIPPCISSSSEQDSIFLSKDKQLLSTESTPSTLSEGSAVQKICSDVERSVNGLNKNLVENEKLNSNPNEALVILPLSQQSTSCKSKNVEVTKFNEADSIAGNTKPPQEKAIENPMKSSQGINFINNAEFVSLNNNSAVKDASDPMKISDKTNQEVCFNNKHKDGKEIPESLNNEAIGYSEQGSDLFQGTMCTENISPPHSFINSEKSVSTSQAGSTSSQEKNFNRNPPPLKNPAFPNISNDNVILPNSLPVTSVASTQASLTTHSSYGISEKDYPFFNSAYCKRTVFNSNEKPSNNCNNAGENFSNNIFPIYNSSTFPSNGGIANAQSSFNLKPAENLGNALPPSVGRNSDVYPGFNQTISTETIGDKPFYSQNVSFPHNSLPKSSNWDKTPCNKPLYSNNYGEIPEESNTKTTNAFQRSKNVSFEKQNEQAQLTCLSFQNESAVTSQNNTFFHNVLPSSCGFSDTPGVFSYHNTSNSVASSYSFIPQENITSLSKNSNGGMKNVHQGRAYFPEITSNEKSKGNSFGANDKLSVGNISFYPSTSQTLLPGVYPNTSQSSLATVYSTFAQPSLSNAYSNSSQLSTNSYPNISQQNTSAYPIKGTGGHTIPAHAIVSSVYNNFSQPNALGIYTSSTMSNVFTKSSQSTSSVAYSAPAQQSIPNLKNTNSHSYLNSGQHNPSTTYSNPLQSNMSNAYITSTHASTSMSYASTMQPAYSTSALNSTSNTNISARSCPTTAQTNLLGAFPNTPAAESSTVYGTDNHCVNTSSSLSNTSNAFPTSTQTPVTNTMNRSSTYTGVVNDSPLYQSDVVSKPKQTSENSVSIPLNSFKSNLTNSLTASSENIPVTASNKNSDLVLPNNPTNDITKNKESRSLHSTVGDSNLNGRRQNTKSMQTSYSHDIDVSRNKFITNTVSSDQRTTDSERSVIVATEKSPTSQISISSSKSVEHTEKNKSTEVHKYNNYDFVAYKGKDIQNKAVDSNTSLVKNNESVDKSVQSTFKKFVSAQNCEEKSLEAGNNKLLPTSSNQKSVSTEVIQGDINYNYNNQPSNNYSKAIQTVNSSFTASQPNSSAQSKSFANFNSSVRDTLNNHFSESGSNPRSVGACSAVPPPQSNEPHPSGSTAPPPELINKAAIMDISHRPPEKQDKSIQKSYESSSSNAHLKVDVPSDFLKSKDIERNTFIPIIDDVRLPTDFSSDLFSSLQVPTGGAHSESISPTAAFLLAFPLVSTSRNVENIHDNENQENQTSTPTTILQIGNIEPPSTELFHPIDFQKSNSKTSDHFDINNDYLNVNELNDKQNQNPYKRCEKRKETFTEYSKEVRPTDPKQKSKSSVITTSTYTQSYTHPLLSCSEFQYCEKDSTQWQQEFPVSVPKDQKKTCDRKKEKAVQKGCYHQTYPECYSYKEKKRKQQNRISVNWMTTPENRDQPEYQSKESELVNSVVGPPAQSLYGGISIDFPTEPFPDFCNSKKTNNYSWSPNKMLLPSLDSHLMIPSTLPTLVGDLALGTSTPSESYKTYEVPKSQGQISKKTSEKLDMNKKQSEFSKNQANFFSVSQLVDPKSKKQKTSERNYKRTDKTSKPRNNFNCPKRKDDHCMYYEERNSFVSNQNQYNEKRHPYKGNYSAESLIGAQHNEVDFSSSFNYQQNTNYFQSEFPPTVESAGQQYGYFQQTHFPSFSHDECQEFGFNTSQRGIDSSRQKVPGRKEENYQGTGLLQPQICPPYTKSMNYIPSSHLNANTTTTLTNFNLSTIFPEMNDQRVGTSVQPPQQMNSSYSNSQNYRNHIS